MLFCWEMCGEERDLVVNANGVYGGGGPRVAVSAAAAAVVAVVVVVVVTAELRGRPTGGADGVVKRKGPLGKAAAVAENARRRRDWAVVVLLWPDEEDARLRTVLGVVLLRGRG
jgi:hypothetical protein